MTRWARPAKRVLPGPDIVADAMEIWGASEGGVPDPLCRAAIEAQAVRLGDPRRVARIRRYLPGYDPVKSLEEEAAAYDALPPEEAQRQGAAALADRCRQLAVLVADLMMLAGPVPELPPEGPETALAYLGRPMPIPEAAPPVPKKSGKGGVEKRNLFSG